jgi:Flp pilus assembly protein TadG
VSARLFLQRLGSDRRGSTIIEFGLLAPAFIVMLLGVLQVGIGLQNYNAMRSLSADVARYAMIEKAKGTVMSNSALQTYAENLGSGAPYLLIANNLDVTIEPATTPQISDASELTLTVEYQIPSVLEGLGLEGPEIDYQRPIFLSNS